MTREETEKQAVNSFNANKVTVLELPTSFGKTKIAISCIKPFKGNILIVVPKKVLIDNWYKELQKWGCSTDNIQIICYRSLRKIKNADVIVFDEAHNLSEAMQEILTVFLQYHRNTKILALSATLPRERMQFYKSLGTYSIISDTIANAIDENILPVPKLLLVPLQLNTRDIKEMIVRNKTKGQTIRIHWNDRFQSHPNRKVLIPCTEEQYYKDISSLIEFYKKKYSTTLSPTIKTKWLRAAKDRLEWLSKVKEPYINKILGQLGNKRTLLFCANIEQANKLCKYSVDSKNKDALKLITMFNKHKVNILSSCNMLNEGITMNDCEVGIFVNINASELMMVQKLGRILRHKTPKIIIPYYVDTREEELVEKLISEYNSDYVMFNNYNNLNLN